MRELVAQVGLDAAGLKRRFQMVAKHRVGRQRQQPQARDFAQGDGLPAVVTVDRKSTRLNSSHVKISYAVFCLKKKRNERPNRSPGSERPSSRIFNSRV